ncbi:hypothetical protein D3227_19770 [Mesorhizobium waimense]|uniref:Uncharacterized protein n=1 Tax=Mesorhizobium waimense TaxID=1300307 RepID=A0A3A5KKS8_9HYPH|nr:hypothetical protein D3227_19770 [Mesorhizobium waimense]
MSLRRFDALLYATRRQRNDAAPLASPIRIGDRILTNDGMMGVVVCNLDTREFSDEHPEASWGYLGNRVVVMTEAGLIHFPSECMGNFRKAER